MEKKIVVFAAVIGLLAIVLGAFGAHGLKKFLTPEQLVSFETGVRYQMYHALFLLLISQLQMIAVKDKMIIFYLAALGVVLFSGSIYLLSTSAITGNQTPFTVIGRQPPKFYKGQRNWPVPGFICWI